MTEIEKVLNAMTIAQDKQLEARERAEQGTNAVMLTMFQHNQTLAAENQVLKTRINALKSEKKQSEAAHNMAMQALESKHQREMKAAQAENESLKEKNKTLPLESDDEHRITRAKAMPPVSKVLGVSRRLTIPMPQTY